MSANFKTLVLSANYQPISIFPLYTIPAQDAIQRVLNGNATAVVNYNKQILTQNRDDLYWPSVIANHNNFSFVESVRLRHDTLYYRDHGTCQYCKQPLTINTLTKDHVVPRSRGGEDGWNNVVASCEPCNTLKADHPPKGRWVPVKAPHTPTFFELLEIRRNFPISVDDPRWLQFLGEWKVAVNIREDLKEFCSD